MLHTGLLPHSLLGLPPYVIQDRLVNSLFSFKFNHKVAVFKTAWYSDDDRHSDRGADSPGISVCIHGQMTLPETPGPLSGAMSSFQQLSGESDIPK